METADQLHPKFIAVVGAPIPYMIGTDLEAIAEVVEKKTRIPCMGFAANGMQLYTKGISMAFDRLVQRFCTMDMAKTEGISVNILGMTPLDFSVNGSADSIREWLKENGMQVNSCFAMGSSLEEIEKAGAAHVNLVVSYGGLAAAKRLQKRYGTPYVVGVPFGKAFAEHLAGELRLAAEEKESRVSYQEKSGAENAELVMIGESVYSSSLASAIWMEKGIPVKVLCPLDTEAELLRAGDLHTPEEDDLMREIAKANGVIADPLYRAIVPKEKAFYELPHEAFSGRIYDLVNPNLINRKW